MLRRSAAERYVLFYMDQFEPVQRFAAIRTQCFLDARANAELGRNELPRKIGRAKLVDRLLQLEICPPRLNNSVQ